MRRFATAFSDYGFALENFVPCYGMAEATLMISCKPAGEKPETLLLQTEALEEDRAVVAKPESSQKREVVGCGVPPQGHQVRIVDPQSTEICTEGGVGEIWVSGPSVTLGYWDLPKETASQFVPLPSCPDDGLFLRTGDLGFLNGRRLFVTGRLKDLIIIRGRNHYPQDIEATVAGCHPGFAPGGHGAFSVEVNGEEQLVVGPGSEPRPNERS